MRVPKKMMMMLGGFTPWYLSAGIPKANCLAAFKPKGAIDYADSKINLVNPGTFDAADGSAFPSWAAATGWTFVDGSSQYLVIAGALVTAVPVSMVCRFNADTVAINYGLMSICDTASAKYFILTANGTASDKVMAVAGGAAAASATAFTAGVNYTGAAVWSANNARAAFIDGANKGTDATSSTPTSLDTTYIGAYHNGTIVTGFFDGKISACAFYDIALSDAQVLALHTAMAAL